MLLSPASDLFEDHRPMLQCQQSRVSGWLAPLAYQMVGRIVLPCRFAEIDIAGIDHIPRSGPVILAPTHRSRWDALMVPHAVGRPTSGRDVRFMVSANEMRGIQGWFIWRLGGFPVDTDRPGIASVRYGVELLLQQQMVVVFPEGGIFQDRQVHPLKLGPARMALQAQHLGHEPVQIVPIGLVYSDLQPRRGSRCSIRIGQPLSTQSYRQHSPKQGAIALTRDLADQLGRLHQQALHHVLPCQEPLMPLPPSQELL
ncbi:putative acyltransferase [Synechococcus elongatus PCC 6301]|nr:1-acyl-sn-glycerol-3-phosphate acyltransferase [Synechococcus elongatus]BAD78547.1 putative acyltransferase [Synechococcus elongatus PCC 6301]